MVYFAMCCASVDDMVTFLIYIKFILLYDFSGMMLRMFTYLYDLEIVDDDVFLKWKEDLNEDYPGKGKALFQVCAHSSFGRQCGMFFIIEAVLLFVSSSLFQ